MRGIFLSLCVFALVSFTVSCDDAGAEAADKTAEKVAAVGKRAAGKSSRCGSKEATDKSSCCGGKEATDKSGGQEGIAAKKLSPCCSSKEKSAS